MKEVATYENQLEKKTDIKAKVADPNVCEICLKTKFTEGTGRECKYCKLKCCTRCGVEVSIPGAKQVGLVWMIRIFTKNFSRFNFNLNLGSPLTDLYLSAVKTEVNPELKSSLFSQGSFPSIFEVIDVDYNLQIPFFFLSFHFILDNFPGSPMSTNRQR